MKHRLDASTYSIYRILKDQAENGMVTVSYPELIDETGWSLDTILRVMGSLMQSGKIERISGGKNRIPSTYKIS